MDTPGVIPPRKELLARLLAAYREAHQNNPRCYPDGCVERAEKAAKKMANNNMLHGFVLDMEGLVRRQTTHTETRR